MRSCKFLLLFLFICQNIILVRSNKSPSKAESNKGENVKVRSGKGEPSKAGPSKGDPSKGGSSDEGPGPSKKQKICDILPGNISNCSYKSVNTRG